VGDGSCLCGAVKMVFDRFLAGGVGKEQIWLSGLSVAISAYVAASAAVTGNTHSSHRGLPIINS